jgi:hypothetical protein
MDAEKRPMSEAKQSIYALLKFGMRQHLETLRNDGLLFMRSLAEFTNLESDLARGDAFEGATEIIQPHHVKNFILEAPGCGKHAINPSDLSGPVRIAKFKTASCNVYCMYAITGPVDGQLVSSQNFQFGDSFVLVLNPGEFLSRTVAAVKAAGLCRLEWKLVEYFDEEEYSGEVGRFRKRSIFAYQNEFRIAVEPGSAEPKKLAIGSLLDVTSEVLPLCEANQHLDFSTRSFREAGFIL